MHRGIAEVEAESVALMVGAAHGLATEDYTIPYVASWASSVPGKTPVQVVQATAERVRNAAVTILDRLDTAQVGDGTPPGLGREGTRRDVPASGPGPVPEQAFAPRQVETVAL